MEQTYSFGIVLQNFNSQHQPPRRWSRRGWNGPGQFIELQAPNPASKMTLPCIYITTVQGDRVPWLASQTDLLAQDWYCVVDPTSPVSWMFNCRLEGPPPLPYQSWSEWFEREGSKGILRNLKISTETTNES
jgi:hypothetical protein